MVCTVVLPDPTQALDIQIVGTCALVGVSENEELEP